MREGVPRLLDAFAAHGVRATFLLSFGPDNAGKAIWNVFRRRGFFEKMWRSRAPSLYGWRTMLSGTLLPARPIAVDCPELVRRIEAEGHEVGIHAWDHRLWQDHLADLTRAQIEEQIGQAWDAFEKILGWPARAMGAPGWFVTPTSLEIQDGLGLLYASDMRGGPPGLPELEGYTSTTLQIPSTQPCLEELLGQGDLEACAARVLASPAHAGVRVIPIHAEVEGGIYLPFLHLLLEAIAKEGAAVITLEELARELLADPVRPPRIPACLAPIQGRSGVVFAPADGAHRDSTKT
jgi:peptidoglycan/xylan/chitin deacetylase (PgdA/CDA1 family)